jgi:hypothetical protein
MSCLKCDEAQGDMGIDEEGFIKNPMPITYTFVRVGKASVLISGCRLHMQDLVLIIKKGQEGIKFNDSLL